MRGIDAYQNFCLESSQPSGLLCIKNNFFSIRKAFLLRFLLSHPLGIEIFTSSSSVCLQMDIPRIALFCACGRKPVFYSSLFDPLFFSSQREKKEDVFPRQPEAASTKPLLSFWVYFPFLSFPVEMKVCRPLPSSSFPSFMLFGASSSVKGRERRTKSFPPGRKKELAPPESIAVAHFQQRIPVCVGLAQYRPHLKKETTTKPPPVR